MSQTSGLRFDIYERVHLPEDGAGMRELTSIELTPEITVESQGEQAVLKGYLLLSGSYASVDETRGEEQLTHRIPVEITLPLNRIHSVDDISVDIEQFDIDLLSTRSLNVTGVLSLQGIQMAADPAVDWREEEEVVFTHRAEEEAPAAPTPWAVAAQAAEEAETNAFAAEPQAFADEREEAYAPAAEAIQEIIEETAEAEEQPVAVIAAEEKKEIKIAFTGKPEEEIASESFGGLNSLVSAPAAPVRNEPVTTVTETPAAPAAAATAATAATAAPQAANTKRSESEGKDRLEWKSLFLSNASEAPQFRRVRMCIAQKQDTVETIAERYKKNPRELMLYNRLNDQYLQEGQVVYIP